MLFKFLFTLLKNLRWVITLVLIGGSLYLAVTQYQAIKATPLGALLPSIAIPTLPPFIEQVSPTPSGTSTPSATTFQKSMNVTIETAKGKVTFLSEVAQTDEARALGLMYRTSLPKYAGMYFIYETDVQHGFWMKNCEIPLDMLFIDSLGKIVDIKENIRPCKETNPKQEVCPSYIPKSSYRAVLEINGGSAKVNSITVGNYVKLGN